MMEIEIKRMTEEPWPGETSDSVASFDALIGDFRLQNVGLRRSHKDGALFAVPPGRGRGKTHSISLVGDCPTRRALTAAAIAHWRAKYERG